MKLEIVRRIACEKHNSTLVPFKPINPIQGVRLKKLYQLLILLRIILTLNLQTGWIHQDEFTNSLEVITGDYFDLTVFKSPAFNSTFPTRSIPFLQMTIYVPYVLAHRFLTYLDPTVEEPIPIPEALILIPRFFNVFLSFIVDFLIIKYCKIQDRKPRQKPPEDDLGLDDDDKKSKNDDDHSLQNHSIRLITLASSQILLVFTPRTHPALINLILFGTLLCFVSDSLHRMEEYVIVLNDYHAVDGKKKVREKVKFLKELKALHYSPFENLHWIAIVVVCGLFNDPEFFLAYASVPIFFYLQRGISNPHIGMTHFHLRLFVFLIYFFTFSIPFVLWDSFYHHRVTWNDFKNLNLGFSSFVVTPVNHFITKSSSLRDITDLPMIFLSFISVFNILGLMGLVSFSKELYDLLFKDWKNKPRLDSQWTFLNCCWFIPLLLLIQFKSTFDLVPLIFPLVIMHGHKIPLVSRFSSKIGIGWFLCNILGVGFWGYLNQGGILSSFIELQSVLSPHRFNETYVDILLAQMTPVPPTFVLTIPSKWKTIITATSYSQIIPDLHQQHHHETYIQAIPKKILRLEFDSKIRVFHIGLSPLPLCHFENEIIRILNRKQKKGSKTNFILLPEIGESLNCFRRSNLTYVKTYWNHFHFQWPFTGGESGGGFGEDRKTTMMNQGNNLRENSKFGNVFPKFSHGLNLYRFEENSDVNEGKHPSLFSFTNDSFQSYTIHCLLFIFTSFLFIMSFLTFVL